MSINLQGGRGYISLHTGGDMGDGSVFMDLCGGFYATAYLDPDEARKLADELLKMADEADEKKRRSAK